MQSIIYLFVSPSGRAYAGKHICDHVAIPRRGTGPLPDKVRYKGGGKLWQNVARKHGPNLRWIILRRFPEGTPRAQVDAAERRAIRLVRRLWADRCANIRDGGEGFTSAESLSLWSDPGARAKMTAAFKEAANRPEVRAKNIASAKAQWADPEARAKISAANKEAANRPEVRAKISATKKALAVTPERKAQLGRARQINNRKRRARKALVPFTIPPAVSAPAVSVWVYRPGSPLGITGPFHNKGKA